MTIRKAAKNDVPALAAALAAVHDGEEAGLSTTGWLRQVYPTIATLTGAIDRDELYVAEEDGAILGFAIVNQTQVDVYAGAPWRWPAPDDEVMVLHTMAVVPAARDRGVGSAFVAFYERCARERGCRYLRLDTNERNTGARRLYKRLGYAEAAVVPCVFNGIPGVRLVLLEKRLDL